MWPVFPQTVCMKNSGDLLFHAGLTFVKLDPNLNAQKGAVIFFQAVEVSDLPLKKECQKPVPRQAILCT